MDGGTSVCSISTYMFSKEIIRMWIYRNDSGEYKEDSFVRLFSTILFHRLSHFLKGEGFRD